MKLGHIIRQFVSAESAAGHAKRAILPQRFQSRKIEVVELDDGKWSIRLDDRKFLCLDGYVR